MLISTLVPIKTQCVCVGVSQSSIRSEFGILAE